MPTSEDLLPGVDPESVRSELDYLNRVTIQCVTEKVNGDAIIAYSSGIDSSVLAELVRRQEGKAKLLTLGTANSSDVRAASIDTLASRSGFELTFGQISASDIQQAANDVAKIVDVDNISHFEDCVSFWLTARIGAKKGNESRILSANGPDEIFCGYDRFRRILNERGYGAVEYEILRALESARNLGEQVARTVSEFGFELIEPFMDESFRKLALTIPSRYKILEGNDLLRKRIWRCYGRSLGIPETTVMRRKKAMQYGMGVHSIVLSMLKKDLIKVKLGKSI